MSKQATILISGAASGIGLGLAQYFAKQGFNLAMTDIQAEKTNRTRKQNSAAIS